MTAEEVVEAVVEVVEDEAGTDKKEEEEIVEAGRISLLSSLPCLILQVCNVG
jgi:hypothetical protein